MTNERIAAAQNVMKRLCSASCIVHFLHTIDKTYVVSIIWQIYKKYISFRSLFQIFHVINNIKKIFTAFIIDSDLILLILLTQVCLVNLMIPSDLFSDSKQPMNYLFITPLIYLLSESMYNIEKLGLVRSMLGQVEQHVRSEPNLRVPQMEDVAHLHHGHCVFKSTLVLGRFAHSHSRLWNPNTN